MNVNRNRNINIRNNDYNMNIFYSILELKDLNILKNIIHNFIYRNHRNDLLPADVPGPRNLHNELQELNLNNLVIILNFTYLNLNNYIDNNFDINLQLTLQNINIINNYLNNYTLYLFNFLSGVSNILEELSLNNNYFNIFNKKDIENYEYNILMNFIRRFSFNTNYINPITYNCSLKQIANLMNLIEIKNNNFLNCLVTRDNQNIINRFINFNITNNNYLNNEYGAEYFNISMRHIIIKYYYNTLINYYQQLPINRMELININENNNERDYVNLYQRINIINNNINIIRNFMNQNNPNQNQNPNVEIYNDYDIDNQGNENNEEIDIESQEIENNNNDEDNGENNNEDYNNDREMNENQYHANHFAEERHNNINDDNDENDINIPNLVRIEPNQRNVEFTRMILEDNIQVIEEARAEARVEARAEARAEAKEENDIVIPKCCICFVNNCYIVLLPCGHICSCSKCSPSLNSCPLCRARILSKQKIYL